MASEPSELGEEAAGDELRGSASLRECRKDVDMEPWLRAAGGY